MYAAVRIFEVVEGAGEAVGRGLLACGALGGTAGAG